MSKTEVNWLFMAIIEVKYFKPDKYFNEVKLLYERSTFCKCW